MEYKTCQKKIIYDFFVSNPDKHFSADEVYNNVCNFGCGKSTVYRLISKMNEDGQIIKFMEEGSQKAYYRIALEKCTHHLHLRCVKCGTVIHLDEEISHEFQREILKLNKFFIDEASAVLPGYCYECKVGV